MLCGFLSGGAEVYDHILEKGSYGMGIGNVVLTENWCCVLSYPRSGSLIFNELVTGWIALNNVYWDTGL